MLPGAVGAEFDQGVAASLRHRHELHHGFRSAMSVTLDMGVGGTAFVIAQPLAGAAAKGGQTDQVATSAIRKRLAGLNAWID